MSSINGSSSISDVRTSYLDNASYAEDGSVVKARAFVTACRALMMLTPKESGTREGHMVLTPDLIKEAMKDAQDWLAAFDTSSSNGSGPSVTRVSFNSFDR